MTLTAWILNILGIVLLGILVDMIMSDNRLQKFVKGIISIITIFVIIVPIPQLLSQISSEKIHNNDQSNITINSAYGEQLAIRQYERAVERSLAVEGFDGVIVKIGGSYNKQVLSIQSVALDISKIIIANEKVSEFSSDKLKELVSKYLLIETYLVIINE